MKRSATIRDGSSGLEITGFIKREYPTGSIVIEDRRGVTYFATPDRVINKEKE